MTKTELNLIKSALQHVATMRVNTVNALPNAPFNTSASFNEAMQNLIRERNMRHIPAKRVVAIAIIAAIVLSLAACCVIYREEIKGFFVEITDKFTKVTSETTNYTGESIYYYPTYVPDGYQLENTLKGTDTIQYYWRLEEKTITLRHMSEGKMVGLIDSEDNSYFEKEINDMRLHCSSKYNNTTVVWKMNNNTFVLRCPDDIPWSEIEAIILSLEPIESEN